MEHLKFDWFTGANQFALGPLFARNEAWLEDYLVGNWENLFGFSFYRRQVRFSGGRLDIVGHDADTLYFIELKNVPLEPQHIRQVDRYMRVLSAAPLLRKKHVRGILGNKERGPVGRLILRSVTDLLNHKERQQGSLTTSFTLPAVTAAGG